jgi:thioredoxin reductase (NADPH)
MNENLALLIIGGGPAGLSAGIYAARNRLSTLLIEKGFVGGMIVNAEMVENYPGFPDGISGLELMELMQKQAVKHGLVIATDEARSLEIMPDKRISVKTAEGLYRAKAVIIACGSERIKLDIPGEKEFSGRGVSYCATCDAAFFKSKPVAVVGGGNSALSEALHLAKFASEVSLIHRRDKLRASPVSYEKARSEPKIKFMLSTVVEEIKGKDAVEHIQLKNMVTGERRLHKISGIFVSIGQQPNTDFVKGIVPLDAGGYIITNEKMETTVPGIYAAGDIRSNSIRQTVSASGDGATAAIFADKYISG